MTGGEVLDARLTAHEVLCESRHGKIDERLDRIDDAIRDAAKACIGLAIALVAFLGGQLWTMGVTPQLVQSAQAQTAR